MIGATNLITGAAPDLIHFISATTIAVVSATTSTSSPATGGRRRLDEGLGQAAQQEVCTQLDLGDLSTGSCVCRLFP